MSATDLTPMITKEQAIEWVGAVDGIALTHGPAGDCGGDRGGC
jgi:hypothetical protein